MSPAIHSAIQEKKKAFYHWIQNGRSNDPSNFYLLEKKMKTSELRKHIRIELSKRRHLEKTDIINARRSGNALFHRLIRKQRGQCHKLIDELNIGQSTYSNENIID